MKVFRYALTSMFLLSSTSAFAADLTDAQFEKHMSQYLTKDENVKVFAEALERHFNSKRENEQKAAAQREMDELESQFKNPVKIDIGSSPVIGPKDAKITIVEFSDFQCPYCQRGADSMKELLKMYPKDVKVVFKNLPLPFHQEAKPAAIAALAAGEQGKYWEMHDELFANQSSLGEELYIKLAEKLGLKMDKFKADLKSDKLAKMVDADAELATKHGVKGTPGFFVNGVQVRGARPAAYFKTIIDRWLAM
jgi:protein-disulfide isomerase